MSNRVETLLWQDVRGTLINADAKLVEIIDKISPDDTFKIYKLRYNYGQEISTKGRLNYPVSPTEVVPMSSSVVPEELRNDLGILHFLPLIYIVTNSVSIFFDVDGQISPMKSIPEGAFLGIWSFLDTSLKDVIPAIWNLRAGVTTILNPNKLNINGAHNNYVSINYNHDYNWDTELLCFANKWSLHQNDSHWQGLYNHIANQNWSRLNFWRNQFTWDYLFSFIQTKLRAVPSKNVFPLLKQLFLIQSGNMPCWVPLHSNQTIPLKEFSQMNFDGINLNENILFYPDFLNSKRTHGLFLPTASLLFEFGGKIDTNLFDEICRLLNEVLQLLNENKYNDILRNTNVTTKTINENIVCLDDASTNLKYLQDLDFVKDKEHSINTNFFNKSFVVNFK